MATSETLTQQPPAQAGDETELHYVVQAGETRKQTRAQLRAAMLTGWLGFIGTFLESSSTSSARTAIGAAGTASPTFTGTPAAPTATPGTNSTQLATTAFVAALGALKANLASPTFTGTPAAPTATPGTNSTQLATTAYADAIAALKANLASPTFTGTPAAPTPAVGTSTTQIATTAMVQNELANKRSLITYSPTLTAASGTYTSASATAGHVTVFGICHLQSYITITTKGTGVNPRITLPFAARSGQAGMAMPAILDGGKGGFAVIDGGLTTATVRGADNTDLVTGDGQVIVINGHYLVA